MTRVYSYGFRPSAESAATLRQQSLEAHRYYCALLALELEHRKKYREIRTAFDPELAQAETELAGLDKLLSARKGTKADAARARELHVVCKARRDAFAELIAPADRELQSRAGKPSKEDRAGKTLSEVRAMSLPPRIQEKRNAEAVEQMLQETEWPEVWRQLTALERDKRAAAKKLRADAPIAHGTYSSVELAVQTSLKTAEGDPRFPAWRDGEGARKVGVQLTNLGRLRIVDAGPRSPNSKGRRSIGRFADVEVDIGEGVTIRGRAVLHRPLPPDAVPTWAYLAPGRRIGKWELQITLRGDVGAPVVNPREGDAKVTLHREVTAWGSLLVGRVHHAAGVEDLELPPALVRALTERPEGLRAVRDMIFNSAREEWIRLFQGTDNLPQWQRDLCASTRKRSPEDPENAFVHPSKWRGTWKLRRIADTWIERAQVDIPLIWGLWKKQRLDRKQDLYDNSKNTIRWAVKQGLSEEQGSAFWLWSWARKDRHLQDIEVGTRSRGLRRRKDLYRCIGADLNRRFSSIVVEKGDLAAIAKRPPKSEELTPEDEQDRRWRFVSGGYDLAQAIQMASGEKCHVVSGESKPKKGRKAVAKAAE